MNSDQKRNLDRSVATGRISPDEYIETVMAHVGPPVHPRNGMEGGSSEGTRRPSRSKLWSVLLGVLIPVILMIKFLNHRFPTSSYALAAQSTSNSSSYTSEDAVSGAVVVAATDPAPPVTLRDIYEGTAQLQTPPPQTPRQEMTSQDAFMLGQIVAALNQQEQALAQQREYERQMAQLQQAQRQQAEQRIQENGQRFARLMQQSPVQARPSSPPAWSPQPAPSTNPSQQSCQYECPHCHQVQTFAFRLAAPPICTRDLHAMNLRR